MLRQKLRNTLAVSLASKPARVLLRVDDFPSLCEESKEFARFLSIALENNIPYLLGVTPYLARQSSRAHTSRILNIDCSVNVHEKVLRSRCMG